MSDKTLIRGGTVVSMDAEIGDLPVGDVLIEDGKIAAVAPDISADAEVIDATGNIVIPGFVDTHRHTWEAAIRGCAPNATLDDYFVEVLDTFAPVYRPEDVYASNLAGALECLNAGITTLVDWSHINNTPEHPDAAVSALMETGIRAQYAYGSANLSLADYWFDSSIQIPGDDVRRVRDKYFSSDDQLLTMGLATRGTGFCKDEVVTGEWQLARELGIPVTVHVAMGRLAGRFGMITALDGLGLLGPDVTYVHACHFSEDEWALVRDSGGTVAVAPQVEVQMGHGWPPLLKALRLGLRPSLSIDVVTTVPGDMFTQMRSAFGTDRGRVNEARLRPQRTGAQGRPHRSRDADRRDDRRRLHRRPRERHGLADPRQAGRRRDPRRPVDQHGSGHRPGGSRRAVRRRVERRHRHRRRRRAQARRQARRRRAVGARSAPGVEPVPPRGRRRAGRCGRMTSPRSLHTVRAAATAELVVPGGWAAGSSGYRRWSAVGEDDGAVHTGFGLCALDPGGTMPTHVHSFEESVYVVEGVGILDVPEGSFELWPGDYGIIPVGIPHRWRNSGNAAVQWAEMQGPGPRRRYDDDTQVVAELRVADATPVDPRDPRNRRFGNITAAHMDVAKQGQDLLAVSASMRTALLVYSGITVKMMVDSDLDAQLSTMFMVQYDP
ncbi:MAG TPA: amidohydrolase family protein, partial [Nocardioidaceae bacterium]|nr:amidohydrolase family protein [Nocardioidaceae bacterium]